MPLNIIFIKLNEIIYIYIYNVLKNKSLNWIRRGVKLMVYTIQLEIATLSLYLKLNTFYHIE